MLHLRFRIGNKKYNYKYRERSLYSNYGGRQTDSEPVDQFFLLTIIVNILIPKAGIKIGSVPLTLGNVLFLFLIIEHMMISFQKKRLLLTRIDLAILVGICFWTLRLGIFLLLGTKSFAEICGYIIPLCVFPFMYFIFPDFVRTEGQLRHLLRIIEKCVFLIMIYAMLQYIFGIEQVQIPGITVNYSDYISAPTSWYMQKSNRIGTSSKIVSTYQNGNIFGLNLLLLFPIAYYVPKRKIWIKMLYICLFVMCAFLTGSRTVYVGCIVYVAVLGIGVVRRTKVKIKSILTFFLSALCIGIGGVYGCGTDQTILLQGS